MNHTVVFRVSLLALVLVLSNCQRQPDAGTQKVVPQQKTTSPAQVLQTEHPFILLSSGELLLVDAASGTSAPLYTLKVGEMPAKVDLETFKLSPDKKYVVWHSAGVGLLAYSLEEKTARIIYKPSAWFTANPYFSFIPDSDVVVFVDQEGASMIQLSLSTNQVEELAIPYPFGTVFKISPDGNHVVFVSGYGQDEQRPSYMFTDASLVTQQQFSTDSEIIDRHRIAWLPDSSGIVAIEAETQLVVYSIADPATAKPLTTLANSGRITDIARVDEVLYVATADGSWQILDAAGAIKARIPQEIAHDLQSPHLIPWHDNSFLADETMSPVPEERFHRLWHLTFKGEKKLLVPKFSETLVDTRTEVEAF